MKYLLHEDNFKIKDKDKRGYITINTKDLVQVNHFVI